MLTSQMNQEPPVEPSDFQVRLLGSLTLMRDGTSLNLPASRKVRALLAYLAYAQHPVHRSQLCNLLWDTPNDPRAELRWCLSKIRRLTNDARFRLLTGDDTVWISPECTVDAVEVLQTIQAGVTHLDRARLCELNRTFQGDFLEGVDLDARLPFVGWLMATRRTFRQAQVSVLERLAALQTNDLEQYRAELEQWLELAPFDLRPHRLLFDLLFREGRLREGEEHLANSVRRFEAEGLDVMALKHAWQGARGRLRTPSDAFAFDTVAAEAITSKGTGRRACVVIMPFSEQRQTQGDGSLADALTHDIITRLAKLRNLFVIARGTVFTLRDRDIGPYEAGRILSADYVVNGSLDRRAGRLRVEVEATETSTGRIFWSETYQRRSDDILLVLEEIGDGIVASIDSEIELVETSRALHKPVTTLDAWEAYHRGLWHMYQFNQAGNENAQHFFRAAISMDPTFARAHAGMSFTHFQNAFLHRPSDRTREIELALDTAGESLDRDDRSPAAHWAMGRALWLRGDLGQAVGELERTIELSPNFSLGHYTLGFVRSQSGDPLEAINSVNQSLALSPFDPLLFGSYAARALSHLRLHQYAEAAEWASRAAARPNAHIHIVAIAAYCLQAGGQVREAQAHVLRLNRLNPNYGVNDLLSAFHFCEEAKVLLLKYARV